MTEPTKEVSNVSTIVSRRCERCQYELKLEWKACPNCGDSIGRQLKRRALLVPLGFWRVTTAGDCEGRTIIDLGTYEGYIDEIAFRLADEAMYHLNFSPAEKVSSKPQATAVHIQLDIASGTWDMTPEQRVDYIKELFKDRPVIVEQSNYYAAVFIKASNGG